MENNGIQDAIEEIEQKINQERVFIEQYGDEIDMVERSKNLIKNYEINIKRLKRAAKGLPIEEELVKKELESKIVPEFIKSIWRRVYLFVTFRAKMEPTDLIQTVQPTEISKEESFFASKNNIMEGAWEDTKIEPSSWKHIDRYIFPIESEYKGYMVQAEDIESFNEKCKRIDKGETQPFYTVGQFQEKFYPAPVLDEPVEQYENDIEFLVQKQVPKPDYSSITANLKLTKDA